MSIIAAAKSNAVGGRHSQKRLDISMSSGLASSSAVATRGSSAIPQIEHEPLHPLPLQRAERLPKFLIRVLAEFREAHVTGLGVEHEGRRHGRNVDLVAHDREIVLVTRRRFARRAQRRAGIRR